MEQGELDSNRGGSKKLREAGHAEGKSISAISVDSQSTSDEPPRWNFPRPSEGSSDRSTIRTTRTTQSQQWRRSQMGSSPFGRNSAVAAHSSVEHVWSERSEASRMSDHEDPLNRRGSRRSSVGSRRSSSSQGGRSCLEACTEAMHLHRCVENRCMVIVSVFFTVYALFGDDIRLVCTDQPADLWFSVMALICLLFFSVELVLKCLVQFDYFLSFYFGLDLVATVSLVLDVTWIADLLFQEDDLQEGGDQARSGRTARVGASMGRVVRVLRLVRLLKLYKAWFEKRPEQHAASRKSRVLPGDDVERAVSAKTLASQQYAAKLQEVMDHNWDDEAEEANLDVEMDSETAVGRKLVAITTRKVIILVLTLLLVLPFLAPQGEVFSTSAMWGADTVWQAFTGIQEGLATTQRAYEESLLKYVYYHNWYQARQGCPSQKECAADSYSQVYWIGAASTDLSTLRSRVAEGAVRASTIEEWEQGIRESDALYDLGSLPSEVHKILSSAWDLECRFLGYEHIGISLLKDENAFVKYPVRCPGDLRPQERFRVSPDLISQEDFEQFHIVFFFDSRPLVRLQAAYGLLTTTFICFVLSLASMSFSSDANELVLQPVERMVTKVRAIRDNPLLAINMAENQLKEDACRQQSWVGKRPSRAGAKRCLVALKDLLVCKGKEDPELMETVVLERTIVKLGSLLALGFGIAGVPIVASNMKNLHNASVDAMIPGNRVDCVIGVARIRDFNTATEVLQAKVMSFVNQIAEIVHGLVQEFNGGANRNNGDTFLLIWRLEEEGNRAALADMSVAAFAHILAEVHRSPVLAQYRRHPGLQQRLGSDIRVDLSFGLHVGWAVEGAVGSEFKIDASYLSPNVSVAEAIEGATRMYGTSLMVSETVAETCNEVTSQVLRLIDRVIIPGSREPLKLYVLDLDSKILVPRKPRKGIPWNVRQRFRARQLLELHKQYKWNSMDLLGDEEHGKEIKRMRRSFPVGFVQTFKMGYWNYSEGEWEVARTFLQRASDFLGTGDGPSVALLGFMQKHGDFKAPRDWRGVRPLPFR